VVHSLYWGWNYGWQCRTTL